MYGRARLGDWWGFLAGWAFVVGKTASCAAMALTFAAYAVPPAWERPAAVGAVLALVAVNYRGITRTARLTRVLLAVVLTALAVAVPAALAVAVPAALAVAVPAGFSSGAADAGRLVDWSAGPNGWYGVLQAAGLRFFAFAGYARMSALGEEVRDPGRTIPRAIPLALGLAVATYAVVAVVLLVALGPGGIAGSGTPLADAVSSRGWAAPVVRIGAAAAALGALLGLVAGIGRTGLAMARTGDLPGWLAAVHPRHRVPHHAELALGAVVCAVVLLVDLRTAIGFSSFGVLLYYLVANVAAWTQDAGSRRWPRALQVAGAAGCVVLAATLPWTSVLAGIVVLAAGALHRGLRLRRGRRA